jgi:prepilin-type N-terminal cleavage/methylation domain-containing protein
MKKRVMKSQQQRGFSLVEVIVAAAILATVTAGAGSFQSAMLQKTIRNNDKSFASEKALQMYDEMRSFVQANQESFITSLDNFSDGNGYDWSLTTSSGEIENPADPLSGNQKLGETWRFVRQIQVDPVLNDDYARQVRVKVWRANPADHTKPIGQPLAAISGVLKTNVDQYPPTQVYDVFMFAAENAPAWWVDVAALRPTFERLLDDLEYRNPGLRYRRHYVSRMGYGRDPLYLPYMNSANNTNSQALPWTYVYPGRISRTNAGLPIQESYVEDYMHGRRRNDNANEFTHASRTLSSSTVPYRHYAMADRFNHVKRYPENYAMLQRMRAIDPNTDVDLVTYLEEMNSDPDQYRNSLIINLHGELVPFPAIRNYSDPARSPQDLPNQRVVTHPENIRYDNNTTQMNLRVHAFQSLPYGEEKLDGDSLNASTESNAGNSSNRDFVLNNRMAQISVFIPTDKKGRNPFDPLAAGFLDHPDANISTDQALDALSPSKIIGNQRRPYARKTYIGENPNSLGRFAGSTGVDGNASLQERRLFYRKTTDRNTIGMARTIEIARDPRLPSDISRVRGGINNQATFANLTGSSPSITLSRDDFAYLQGDRTNQANLTQTLNELIDQTVILDPSIVDPRTGNPTHVGMNLELRVASTEVGTTGSTVTLNFYPESTRINNTIQAYTSSLPSPRLDYARNATTLASTPSISGLLNTVTAVADQTLLQNLLSEVNNVGLRASQPGNVQVVTGTQFNIGTRLVLKRDFEVTTNPTVFGKTLKGIHVMLLDTATRHMQKEGNNVFPIWNTAGDATSNGRYSGLYHDRGDNNENAHQKGDTRRLYRAEYVPAPVNTEGTSTLADDFSRDLTSTDQTSAKNTARWIIGVNLSKLNAVSSNAFNNEMISVETRIASGAPDVTSVLQLGQSEDGDVYQPNSSSTTQENRTNMRGDIYNVSRTFVWTGPSNSNYNTALDNASVPYVERREYLGDPRYMPYADLKAIHTYSRHFYRDSSGKRGFGGLTQPDNTTAGMAGYNGYDRHIGPSWGGSDVDADLNWYFQLYTNGIMKSNSIYNSVTGFSNYYYALGGEMGSDGNSANFDMRKQPWSETNQGSGNASNTDTNWGNEIIGTNLRIPMSTEDTTNDGSGNSNSSDNKWVANPYQGELFPDEDYAFWFDNGNLPNKSYVPGSHTFPGLVADTSNTNSESNRNHRFYRARFDENPLNLSRRELRMEDNGASSFMNGSSNPSDIGKGFNHISAGNDGYLTKNPGEAGRRLADAFNLALPNTSPADRPFVLTGSGGSGGYNDPDIQALRNRLSFVNSATGVRSGSPNSSNVYYNHESATDRTSSAVVQLSRDGASNTALRGFVLMNGFARSQVGGDQTIARLSQAGSLQAYMDSGDTNNPGNAAGRTVQIPRVEITAPKSSIITSNSSTVKFEVSWLRWDGEKYSPAYPDGWRDVTPLVFNAKYFDAKAMNPTTGKPGVWVFVNTLDKASDKMDSNDLSYYDVAHELFTGTSPEVMSTDKLIKTFSWNVEDLEDGNYKLRVEAYRNSFKKTGYTYHDAYITIKRQ